jgi:PIN domain
MPATVCNCGSFTIKSGRPDQTAAWEAFVGSFASSDPDWLKVPRRSCGLSSAGDLGRSSPLVAVGAANDVYHEVCTELLGSATGELLVPATVSAELCYLLEREAGSKSEAAFLRLFVARKLVPVDVTVADYERMAELVEL